MRGGPVRQEDRSRSEDHHQDREPEAEDSPVEGDTEVRVKGSHGTEGGQGGETDGHDDRQDSPEHDRAEDADQPVGRRHDRPGPERTEHLTVVRVDAYEAAHDLAADQEGGEGRDEPECPEGDRLRPDGALHQGHGGGVGLASADAPDRRHEPLDRPDHGGLVPGAAVELQGDIGIAGAACRQPPGQGWSEHAELRPQGGVVVLDDLGARLNDADQLQLERHVGPIGEHTCGYGRAHLGVGVDADGEGRPDMEPVLRGATRRHDELVLDVRVEHPTPDDGGAIDGRVLAVEAAFEGRRRLAGHGVHGHLGPLGEGGIEPDDVGGALDVGQPSDGTVDPSRVPRSRHGDVLVEGHHVRRVGAGQVDGKGTLGAPGAGHRPHGHSAQDAHHQDDAQVPTPAASERGPEAPPGEQRYPSHLSVPWSRPPAWAGPARGSTRRRSWGRSDRVRNPSLQLSNIGRAAARASAAPSR